MAAGDLAKRAAVLCTFIALGSLIKLLQHGARSLRFNFLCPIIVVSLAKLACSLALYALHDAPLRTIPGRLRLAQGVVWRYSVVAGLFCLYDVLSFVNLAHFDPQTFLVFMQLRTVITGMVWEVAFDRPMAWVQRAGLALICFGCAMKQTSGSFASLQGAARMVPSAYALLALQILVNCLAGVSNEVLLKQKAAVPLNLQNAVQYSWTVLWCLAVGLLCPLEGIRLNPLDLGEWAKMLDPRMLPSIAVLTVLGLVTSLLLKLLDSVWKNAELRGLVTQRDDEVQRLQQMVEASSSELLQLHSAVAGKDHQLQRLQAYAEEADRNIKEKDDDVARLQQSVSDHEAKAASRSKHIDKLQLAGDGGDSCSIL